MPIRRAFLSLATVTFLISLLTRATTLMPSPLDFPSDNSLIEACRAGDIPKVVLLLDQGQDANTITPRGLFPLEMAAYKGNLPLIKLLLSRGANINANSYFGPAIVHSKTEEIALFLLKSGADINLPLSGDGSGAVFKSLFGQAASQGWNTLLRLIHKKMQDSDLSHSLFGPASAGHLETVKLLLKWGAQVDPTDQQGLTPLMGACYAGQVDTAKELICAGANVNHREHSGMTVLTLTLFRCWNPSPVDDYGVRDKRPILDLLIRSGAKIEKNVVDKLRDTPCGAEYEFLMKEQVHH